MRLRFKRQAYQTAAVEAVVNVFSGQLDQGTTSYRMDGGPEDADTEAGREAAGTLWPEYTGHRNGDVTLTEAQLLEAIHKVQTAGHINLSNEVVKGLGCCQLDVEMETGTGKTYVYIKTLFELNRRYGWTKYMVVVPNVAIREGVMKSFDITADHFLEQYGKRAHYFVYSSSHLSQIDEYSQSADLSVMIINTQAFNTIKEGASSEAARIIYSQRDQFNSRRPIDVIAANRPIVVLDEPQKMGGAATQKGLENFKPLFTLNYSATHKETHNPVYVLDALDAFNQRLVKKIAVVGFEQQNQLGFDSYLYLSDIVLSPDKPPLARVEMEVKSKGGNIGRRVRLLREGDKLYDLSGELEQYRGFMLTDIDPVKGCVSFGNGKQLRPGEVTGNVGGEHLARLQIRETIKAHLDKERALFGRGIKCLSLFFLDEVARYRRYDDEGHQILGPYGDVFEQEYRAARQELLEKTDLDPNYRTYLSGIEACDTHAGYFSIDKKGHAIDSQPKSRSGDTSEDISAYDLILKNKERLLSLAEPVRFIFSHSALREGWDNPNVFQICSLRQSGSTSQKRQEVGRGLRLCVDKEGVRQDDEALGDEVQKLNCLTVIAAEGYAKFSEDLQKDICADLYDRPSRADVDFFTGKTLVMPDGAKRTLTKEDAHKIYFHLCQNGYIDDSSAVQPAFREAVANGTLEPLTDDLQPCTEQVSKLMQALFDPSALRGTVENARKVEVPENKLNANFHKREFQELWQRINHKGDYLVYFDSEELIKKSVSALDKELHVARPLFTIVRGAQRDTLTHNDMEQGDMMQAQESSTEYLAADALSEVRYDLLGAIGNGTRLTRRTVAAILMQIRPDVFEQFKVNPEEFIQQVIRIVGEQLATMVVDHIVYQLDDQCYDSEIFTQEKHTSMDKAYRGKKSIMDWVFTDGAAEKSVERKFVERLDLATEVAVYAKLPKGFKIPTPVGDYSPDWAIAFEKDRVKHVYFVAETKGSMSSLQLREIERQKIECAHKFFEMLAPANVTYGQVDSYDALLKLVR